jgi:IS5 family transposase
MIRATFEEAHTPEWIEANINRTHELVILRQIIPWEKIVRSLTHFYSKDQGPEGKSLRMMAGMVIIARFYDLSDRNVVKQVKENRYIQHFCNVPDEGLQTFMHYSSLCVFRKRIGEKGFEIIEKEVFEVLRRSGVIKGDNALIDSTVLQSNIIYPNDVQLIYKAFKKMRSFAKLHNIPVWWDDKLLKEMWREFSLDKESRAAWLIKFNEMFLPALKIFQKKVKSLNPGRQKNKALKMIKLLNILKEQTSQKLAGEIHIKNRIVSLDDPDARPIKKGKSYPECEFGTTAQMSFNRQGFMITVENFIGNPGDKTLYPDTVELYIKRTKGYPDTIVTDLGSRSRSNFEKTPEEINNVFLGRSSDITGEEKRDFCQKSRSATEGFIAVAKNLRGFGKSLWHTLKGHKMWSLICQTAYNLKKFLQLYSEEEIEEEKLSMLGLL